MTSPPKPDYLTPKIGNIPGSLKALPQWVLWRAEPANGRWTKVPYQVNGKHASTTNDETWADFKQVEDAYLASPDHWTGFGLVLAELNDLCGIDLDHVRDRTNGEIVDWARELIEKVASYAEVSPSGTGVRILLYGQLPEGSRNKVNGLAPNKEGVIEVYDNQRYLTITGHHLPGSPETIEDCQKALEALCAKYLRPKAEKPDEPDEAAIELFDDDQVEKKARSKFKKRFEALFDDGNTSAHNGDDSSADLALANYLVIAGASTEAQLERLFARSKLAQREKWKERADYRHSTLTRALASANPEDKTRQLSGWVHKRGHVFARDHGRLLWHYRDGVYLPEGEEVIAAEVKDILRLGNPWAWRPSYAADLHAYELADAPFLLEREDEWPLTIINVKNGLLHLGETPDLRPHTPDFLWPLQLPVTYDPNAECPRLEAFFKQVLPTDVFEAGVHWQIAALLMTPRLIQYALLLYDEIDGGCGKSTFIRLLRAFIGEQNCAAVPLHSLEKERFKASMLYGKLANFCADLPAEDLGGSSTLKALTGGDQITAERKFGHPFGFTSYAKLVFASNTLPFSSDAGGAFYDRWMLIKFQNKYRGTDAEIDQNKLVSSLATPSELSGLLNRALNAWPTLTSGRLTKTQSMTDSWVRFRSITSPLCRWLTEVVVDDPEGYIVKNYLFDGYNRYLAKNRQPTISQGDPRFTAELKLAKPHITETKMTIPHRGDKKRANVWKGIRFIVNEMEEVNTNLEM